MKIRQLNDFRAATDTVCVNAVGLQEKKVSSIRLEQGKALQVCVERHPEIKTVAKAYRACGGIGNPPAHALMTRNTLLGYVLTGYMTEDSFDSSNLNDHKQASPIANLLEKHKDKFVGKGADMPDQVRRQVAEIMTDKPEDSVKQLKAIRKQVEDFLGINQEKPALERLQEALDKLVPELDETELPDAYQLLFATAKTVVESMPENRENVEPGTAAMAA